MNAQILQQVKIKTLFFSLVFTGLAVAAPFAAHYFGGPLAGRAFLPMHIFVLVAGLLLGWRAGLFVGVLTPFISYSLTHMPPAAILPFVILEIAAYGFFAGFLREKFKLNVYWALLGAMVFGRALVWLAILILPTKLAAGPYILSAVSNGWRGIIIQILAVPIIVKGLGQYFKNQPDS